MKAIKWYYQLGRLHGEPFATVYEAVRSAIYASEEDAESLACIETEDGERFDWGHPRFIDIERDIEQMSNTPDPTLTHYVQAQAPDGEWVLIESATTAANAAKRRDELAAVIGAGRVSVRRRNPSEREAGESNAGR